MTQAGVEPPHLVDTSVWIEYLRGRDSVARDRMIELITTDETIATCEPVVMELLAGASDDVSLRRLERTLDGLPRLAVDQHRDFREAAAIFRATRRAGVGVRAMADCLIAAIAIRHGAVLVHREADYEAIARVTSLQHESLS